ncbi:MAG: SigE family RNA polymerase sigma factor [Actinomycetota bacterium]|nr:SigE family RNA polymerase sigma factor [Actinomycetota bacterium]
MSSSQAYDADDAVTLLYSAHYRSLVRLAALLLRDVGEAEEIVQDAFVAMHGRWDRLRERDKAVAYLRQAVVNRARSALRHRAVQDRHRPAPLPDAPSAEHGALAADTRREVIATLNTLPPRQREALVLRYYLDLSEAEIAAAMGVSRGAVKSHASRGVAAMRQAMERS